MITRKLREYAKKLREAANNKTSVEEVIKLKNTMLSTVYKMLVVHLGEPPESFNWQVRDKKKNFHRYNDLTPKSFFNDHVGIDLNNLVCLIDCPMSDKKYNRVYTVEYLGNVIEGNPIRYLNVEIDILKRATIESIKNNDPVWFGCDVSTVSYTHLRAHET